MHHLVAPIGVGIIFRLPFAFGQSLAVAADIVGQIATGAHFRQHVKDGVSPGVRVVRVEEIGSVLLVGQHQLFACPFDAHATVGLAGKESEEVACLAALVACLAFEVRLQQRQPSRSQHHGGQFVPVHRLAHGADVFRRGVAHLGALCGNRFAHLVPVVHLGLGVGYAGLPGSFVSFVLRNVGAHLGGFAFDALQLLGGGIFIGRDEGVHLVRLQPFGVDGGHGTLHRGAVVKQVAFLVGGDGGVIKCSTWHGQVLGFIGRSSRLGRGEVFGRFIYPARTFGV